MPLVLFEFKLQAESGEHLKELLRQNQRYIFTLIQKFGTGKGEVFPLISERDDQRRNLEYKFSRSYPILTSNARLDTIAEDIIHHFNERGYLGKAMVVCLDKPTAVKMFDKLTKFQGKYLEVLEQERAMATDTETLREKDEHVKWVHETEIAVVVSSEQNEKEKFDKLGIDIVPHRKK